MILWLLWLFGSFGGELGLESSDEAFESILAGVMGNFPSETRMDEVLLKIHFYLVRRGERVIHVCKLPLLLFVASLIGCGERLRGWS